jgi:hypothetical protein
MGRYFFVERVQCLKVVFVVSVEEGTTRLCRSAPGRKSRVCTLPRLSTVLGVVVDGEHAPIGP